MFRLSQIKTDPLAIAKPLFDIQAATTYNAKSQHYFTSNEADIKRLLNTSADWKSPEFAQAVYDWQGKNGFSGKWIDGKMGPATMAKMAKLDATLAKSYDAYAPWKAKHVNDAPSKKVLSLAGEVDRIRKEMGATDIPLNMLMGWIQVESGGRLDDLTQAANGPGREAGLFQISEGEARAIGADQDRIMKDQDYAIKTGIELARHHADALDRELAQYPTMQQYFTKGSDMYWRLAMMGFSAGDGTVTKLLQNMSASGESFKSWNDVMNFVAANPGGYKHSPIKWSYHINRAFNLGNQMVGNNVVASHVALRIKKAKRGARALVLGNIK